MMHPHVGRYLPLLFHFTSIRQLQPCHRLAPHPVGPLKIALDRFSLIECHSNKSQINLIKRLSNISFYFRKQQMGVQHYHHTLLRKCWLAWQHYVSVERQKKDVHAEQDVTRNKMASFLQAAGILFT